MPITSTNTFSLHTIQQIDIDCSAVTSDRLLSQEFGQLISWVRTVPQRSAVHVRLRYATGSSTGRKLKSIFQSLGCTVSMSVRYA